MEELKQKLESLEARAVELQQQIIVQPDRDVLRLELIALRNQIVELQKEKNILLEQSRVFLLRIFLKNIELDVSCSRRGATNSCGW